MSSTASNKTFLDRLAFLTSALGSPFIVVTAFTIWSVAAYSHTALHLLLWGTTAVLLTVLVPMLYIQYGVKRGVFSDIHVMLREQRAEPFRVAILSTLLLTLAFWIEHAPRELIVLSIGVWVSGFAFYLITQVWKISIHAAALTGSVVMAYYLITPKALYFLLALPLVIWARLHRGRHDVWQALVAAALVSLIGYLVLSLFGLTQ